MKKKRVLVIVVVGFVSFLSGGWLLQRGTSQASEVYAKARLFENVLAHIAQYAVDSVSEQQLYDLAIDGLIGELNDPYADFLRPKDFDELSERTSGNYGGLGMQIDVRDGWITVIAPMASSPAEAAGIESGDRIVEVEGVSTFGWRNDRAVSELRGEPGSEVRVGIRRPGVPETIEFTLERATIHVSSVRSAMMLGEGVGYVSLSYATISETVTDEVSRSVEELREAGARSLILDLRNNPGGLLNQGVALTDLFLDKNQVVVDSRGRDSNSSQTYRASKQQKWPEMPIVVLVNGGTASAAEIFAGALQDHDRAVVLGTPTFGKGLVQTVFAMGPRHALQITTGHWFTPSGRTIQRPIRRVDGSLRIVGGREEQERDRSTDTSLVDPSQVFHTDGGREVVGGGGIRPDVTVRFEPLTDLEAAFTRSLGAKIPDYRDVLTTYSLELKANNSVSDPGFTVTRAMRNEIMNRLAMRGIDVPDSVFAGVRTLLDRQIGYEVARYVFGGDEETRRRAREDIQIGRALSLLDGVHTPAELIAVAEVQSKARRSIENQ